MTLFDTSVYSEWGSELKGKLTQKSLNLRAVAAEFIGMIFFVIFGCGTAVTFSTPRPEVIAAQTAGKLADLDLAYATDTAALMSTIQYTASWGITTAFAFGIGIVTMAYAIGHISGAHLNPAVSLGLVLSGNCNVIQGIANVVAQFGGSIIAALVIKGMSLDISTNALGSNSITKGYSFGNAYLGEIFMTAALVFVVLSTVCDSNCNISPLAPLAIGFTVFLAHAVLLPVDGCSINPARSFGPALISGTWDDIVVFLTAPLVGAVLAVCFWLITSKTWNHKSADVFEYARSKKNDDLDTV